MEAAAREVDSGQQCADALVASRARILTAEAEQAVLVAAWADLHGAPDDPEAVVARLSATVLPGTEVFRRFGGSGTPEVGEFAAAELGVLLGTSTAAAATLIADVMDLRHRLPLLWKAVRSGSVRVWQAREAAKKTRAAALTREQSRGVDAATTPYLSSLPWGRWLGVLDANIIAADPAAAQECRTAAASARFVETGQCDEFGLRTVIARANAGDAIWFVAMCDRIARILEAEGDTDPVGARRSKALRILANPAEAFELLASHRDDEPSYEPSEYGEPREPGESGEPGRSSEAGSGDGTVGAPCATCGRSGETVLSGDLTAFRKVAEIEPAQLLPGAVLYLHVSHESFLAALAGRAEGVGRMEGIGPVTVEQVQEFLSHAHVTLTPVIDLDEGQPVDGYEVPDRMHEQLHLRSPATAFPYTPSLSRRADSDHTVPYLSLDRGGPLGQTRISNLGRLLRYHHRVKTHGHGWVHRQPRPGVHLWRTPHGYWCRVDHTGTHFLGKHPPAELTGTPAEPTESPVERAFAQLLHTAA